MNADPLDIGSLRFTRRTLTEADRRQARPIELRSLWLELLDGNVKIVDHFCTDERCYLCLGPGSGTRCGRRCSASRNVEILERVLLGDSQKAVALDLDLSASTVALAAAKCLHSFGLSCSATGVPMLLVMAVRSLRLSGDAADARQTTVQHRGASWTVVSAARPDSQLARVLSGSECEVTRLRVEGHTYAEIATIRQTSRRTVANQLSMAFRRLRVSGRVGLLNHLMGGLGSQDRRVERGQAGDDLFGGLTSSDPSFRTTPRSWDLQDAS